MSARSHTTVVVIGAGQAGLATSRCLTDRAIDHVVLERGRIAERWRSERWDSLRLLTPNWQTRLPGRRHFGDPEGFMTMPELIAFLDDYAASFAAPVEQDTTVTSVARGDAGFVVTTDRGVWQAPNVVVATGPYHEPRIPPVAAGLHPSVAQFSTSDYRRPAQLPDGGVLVVGASASGVQLAHELRSDGREVTLAVGSHTFLPRRYRGLDIQWWLDQTGVLDTGPQIAGGAKRPPEHSLQLVGDDAGRSLGLRRLRDMGVRLAGRFVGVGPRAAMFADDLGASCATSYRRQERILDRIDHHVETFGLSSEVDPPDRPAEFVATASTDRLDFGSGGATAVVWATGHRRTYPWLHVPVLDHAGEIRHVGGVTPLPGLYAIGLPFLRTRKSTFIDGVGADAEAIVDHLATRLSSRPPDRPHHHPSRTP